jgi:hypothetical protein
MQAAMTLNVQGAAPTPWPDPTTLAAAVPPPPVSDPLPLAHARAVHHEERRVEAPEAASPYDAMRAQAYRRDAAEAAATLGTQAAPATATASTSAAPAVKVAPPPQVNLLPFQPDAPYRTPPPAAPPAVRAPEAVDAGKPG